MESTAESLCGLVLREFEHAAEAGDVEKVIRFFKMFPSIGRTNVGSEAYGPYVCQGVAARAKDTLTVEGQAAADGAGRLVTFFYASAAIRLFEHIAK